MKEIGVWGGGVEGKLLPSWYFLIVTHSMVITHYFPSILYSHVLRAPCSVQII